MNQQHSNTIVGSAVSGSSLNLSSSGSSGSVSQESHKQFSIPRICRDFVRGICRRKNCRYPHVLSPDLIIFCHDYQNAICPRINCKFLHYTLQEEEYYRKFGELPQLLEGCESMGGPINDVPPPVIPPPVFPQHCTEQVAYGGNGGGGGLPSFRQDTYRESFGGSQRFDHHLHHNSVGWNDHHVGSAAYRSNDRPILHDFHPCDEFQGMKRSSRDSIEGSTAASFKRLREDIERSDFMQVVRRFEEEQTMLRRRIEGNEIKISELRAANEYLLAQIRLNGQQCSTIVSPVTVSQTTSQPQTPQVMGAVSIAPVQVQATPIVSIATPQTQIIANSATPLAIAANTSQGQQLAIAQQNITSLSNTSQTLQPAHAQQILGTSQITLAPGLAQAPSMGLTINTSQALAMSNATQPIISYPVMTHSILPH